MNGKELLIRLREKRTRMQSDIVLELVEEGSMKELGIMIWTEREKRGLRS